MGTSSVATLPLALGRVVQHSRSPVPLGYFTIFTLVCVCAYAHAWLKSGSECHNPCVTSGSARILGKQLKLSESSLLKRGDDNPPRGWNCGSAA